MNSFQHNLPIYSDRICLSDVESTKDPQRSPELKAQAWAEVEEQLKVFLLLSGL